jgi:xanthine dehydrogenase YagS FAD-binding subunit
MTPFAYSLAPDLAEAVGRSTRPGAEFIAGGTDMLQLLQESVRAPEELVDINPLPMRDVIVGEASIHIGALARLSEVAEHPAVQEQFPAVALALLGTASPQVRNMASIGGNLLQRTRCLYFRDVGTPCNKREPGRGCPAQDGQNRMNAILGGSEHCIAAYPGDLAVALVALDAQVHTTGITGDRVIPVADLHRMPGDTPHVETDLAPGELITGIEIPRTAMARRSHFLKVRDRASFEWALASAAVAIDVEGGTVRDLRIAVGGVATKPWRLPLVEAVLRGEALTVELIARAAEGAADGAVARGRNSFKAELIKRVVARAISEAGGMP